MMNLFNRKSFTLVEMLLAIILITFITITCLGSFIISFNYLRRSMELRTATLALQEEISKVREFKYSDIKALGGTFSSSIMSGLKDADGTISKSLYNGRAEVLKITFKITWTSFDGRPERKALTTLITDHGIDKQ